MKKLIAIAAVSGCLLVATVASPSLAHHLRLGESTVTFEERVTLEGTVATFEWANPHVLIHLDANINGKTERWVIEAASPAELLRRGWARDSLAAGSKLSFKGYRQSRTTDRATGKELKLADGRTLPLEIARFKSDNAL